MDLVGHPLQVLSRLVELAQPDLPPRLVQKDAFPIRIVVRQRQGFLPRLQRRLGKSSFPLGPFLRRRQWRHLHPVKSLREIKGVSEIVRSQSPHLPIHRQRLLKHRRLVALIVFPRILAEHEHHRGQVVPVHRLERVQLNGPFIGRKRLHDRSNVPIVIGQVVPHRRILGIQLRSLLQFPDRPFFIPGFRQETRKGIPGRRIIRVLLQQHLVLAPDLAVQRRHPRPQGQLRFHPRIRRIPSPPLVDPLADPVVRRVIQFHHPHQLRITRVRLRLRGRHRRDHAGLQGHIIGNRHRRIGGQHHAQGSDEQSAHGPILRHASTKRKASSQVTL